MKNSRSIMILLAFACVLLLPYPAAASLGSFLDEVELRASRDMGSFRVDLSLTFDVSDGTIDGLFEVMSRPSDVYMCLRLSEVARQPVNVVVEEHRRHKDQGWGVIAKNLGIKPGSDEFHALKADRLSSEGGSASSANGNKGKKNK
jgi:hypothetical protein